MPQTHTAPPASTLQQLERAWLLLSGQRRHFVEEPGGPTPPGAEFCFMLALGQPRHGHHKGVMVTLDRCDAELVTRHMFGLQTEVVPAPDICDAGREVCNVFADCVAHLIDERSELRMGLPQRIDALEIPALEADSGFSHVFSSHKPHSTIRVVVVGVLHSDFPTLPCPL